jgi:YVTN family beta-propeller protein
MKSRLLIVLFVSIIVLPIPQSVFSVSENPGILLGPKPRGVSIDPLSDTAIVAAESADSVSVVDLESQRVISILSVGRMPRGVAVSRDWNVALVGNRQDGTVSVVVLDALSLSKTLPVGQGPEGIAINPLSGIALVANNKDNSVSVIDLSAFEITGVLPVGQSPIDVAVDPELNVALVVNQTNGTVSVIDLDTYQIVRTISAGKKPIAIAINTETHLAVIANEKGNALTVLDLITWQSKTIAIGKHPIDVAINVLDNSALVVCDEDRRLVVVDLNTSSIIREYALNKLSKGVAVNNFTNIAGVADDYTNSLTLMQLPNPAPEIASLSSMSALRGSGGETIVLTGNKFIKTSISHLGTAQLETTFIDNHNLGIRIPAELLEKAGMYQMIVINPGPSGGVSNGLEFPVRNPVPSISGIGPTEVMAGTNSLTLKVYGTGFFDDTGIYLNGTLRRPIFVSGTKLEVLLTSEDLKKSGTITIVASNSVPGGGLSHPSVLTIKPPLAIKITSPSDGETINKARTIVRGTYVSETRDIGIIVNGVLAEDAGNQWIATGVPLTFGANTITATISDGVGNSEASSITINTSDVSEPVRLLANITSGIAPLTIHFSISTSFVPVSYQMDFEGDGIADHAGTAFDTIGYTYTQEGTFFPTVTVSDDQGNTYTDSTAVSVSSKTELEAFFRNKWTTVTAALKRQDIEGALSYFVERSKEKYRMIFEALKDQLPFILSTFTGFNITDMYEVITEYEIVSDENCIAYSYPGLLVKDRDGVWKFRDF